MFRAFRLIAVSTVMTLAACSPAAPTVAVLPTFVTPPTSAEPGINEAYPTSQAVESSATESVSGFTVTLQRAWRDGKQVYADLCFTLPDTSDWTVWDASLNYLGQTTSEFSSSLVSRQDAAGGQPAQRCDELNFFVPPDADLSAVELNIASIGAYPSNDEFCTMYMPKIQQALDQRGTGIKLDCVDVNGTFVE